MPDESLPGNPRLPAGVASRWPGLASRPVVLGGVRVTCAQAAAAAEVLAASRASAIASVLRAAGSPLGGCDYWAAARPYLAAARAALAPTGGIGPRGRHVAKAAFALAVEAALGAAVAAETERCLAAFSSDERYAAAMAAEAVALRSRAHAAAARAQARAAVTAAAAQCRAAAEPCALAVACGTGTCPFAAPALRGLTSPAVPGRIARPPCHPGPGFGDEPAVRYLLAASPWHAAVHVADAEEASGAEEAA